MLTSKTLVGKIIRLPLRMIPKEAVLPVLMGPLAGTKWVAGSATHGAWLGTYERSKHRLFADAVKPRQTVFDIGAHVGFYSVLSSKMVGPEGRVFAFEPLPRNLRYLRKHIRLNAIKNVFVVDAAVADETGTALFQEAERGEMGKLSVNGGIPVRVVSIDELVAGGALPRPDIIKMDIEGGETLALRGMRETLQRYRPTLFLATHGKDINADCFAFLESLGLRAKPLDTASLHDCRESIVV